MKVRINWYPCNTQKNQYVFGIRVGRSLLFSEMSYFTKYAALEAARKLCKDLGLEVEE